MFAMRRRRILAFASSLMAHLLAAFAAVRQAPPVEKPEPSPPKAMITFVVPRADDPNFPGLNPIDTTKDEPSFGRLKRSSPLRINEFTFDVAKIADHALLLFPFLTPGLSLDHLVVEPEREMLERLANLLASPRSARRNETANRPLVLAGDELQALTDKSWSRR